MQKRLLLTPQERVGIDSVIGHLERNGITDFGTVRTQGTVRSFQSGGHQWMAGPTGVASKLLFAVRYAENPSGVDPAPIIAVRKALLAFGDVETERDAYVSAVWSGGPPALSRTRDLFDGPSLSPEQRPEPESDRRLTRDGDHSSSKARAPVADLRSATHYGSERPPKQSLSPFTEFTELVQALVKEHERSTVRSQGRDYGNGR